MGRIYRFGPYLPQYLAEEDLQRPRSCRNEVDRCQKDLLKSDSGGDRRDPRETQCFENVIKILKEAELEFESERNALELGRMRL